MTLKSIPNFKNQETGSLAPNSRVARDRPCIFTRDLKLRRVEIIRSQ